MGYIYTGIAALALLAALHTTYLPDAPEENLAGVLGSEVAVDTTVKITNTAHEISSPGLVWISDTNGFIFYEDSGGGLSMSSTTDSGATWSAARNVDSVNTTDVISYGVWWEGWTPGTTTKKYIHVVTTDLGVDDTYYTRVDTETGAITATVLGTTQAATCTDAASCYTSITMTATGTLMMSAADGSDVWTVRCGSYLGCSTASNWHEVAGGYYTAPERGDDIPILIPIPGTDNIMHVFWNITADQINWNVYSATSSSWWRTATTSVATAKEDNTTFDAQLIGMTISTTTGLVYLAFTDDTDNYTTADHDINVYTFSTTTDTWTQRTNCTANYTGGVTGAKLSYDARNSTLYCLLVLRTTIGIVTTAGVYYKTSTDDGTAWSATSTRVNDNNDVIDGLTTNILSYDRIGITWHYDTAPRADQQFYDDIVDLYEVVAEASRRAQAEIWFD